MYSDEDEFTPTRENKYICPEEFPYMQIYGEEIAAVVRFRRSNDDFWSSHLRKYLVLRFFDIMKGFHKGSLDLTGRHELRYREHVNLWSRYLDAYREYFQTQTSHAKASRLDSQNTAEVEITPYVDEDAIWSQFCKTWRIPAQMFHFEQIECNTSDTLGCLEKYPDPIFQCLCLTDLPDDVLQVVFDHADIHQATLLGSTCRRLSVIGYRHRFQRRQLAFSPPFEYWRDAHAATDKIQYLGELLVSERTKFLIAAKTLLSNKNGMRCVESLQLVNGWAHPHPSFEEIDPRLHGFMRAATSVGLLKPIYEAWTGTLQGCKNLTSLYLRCLVLNLSVLQGICNLAHLRALELHQCEIPDNSRLLNYDSSPKISTGAVQTLAIVFPHGTSSPKCWSLLPLFTKVRNLSLGVVAAHDFHFVPNPPASIASKCRFWDTLERLQLSNFASHEVDELARWFDLSPQKPRLQHFRLSFKHWVSDESFTRFLRSLNVPHLQILVLSGLQQGEEALFTSIAELFPDLRALSLDRRASNRQTTARHTPWPLQIGQYARWLGLLPELRYFSWNRTGLSHWDASSYPILRFENGFPEELTQEDYRLDKWDPEDYAWTPKTFAAYCPKLEYYSAGMWTIESFIERRPQGKVEIRYEPNQNGVNWLPMISLFDFGRNWDPRIPDVRA